ncbi:hypothetical protein IWX47DRAFT_124943 [Phyllosticta citricarpa]
MLGLRRCCSWRVMMAPHRTATGLSSFFDDSFAACLYTTVVRPLAGWQKLHAGSSARTLTIATTRWSPVTCLDFILALRLSRVVYVSLVGSEPAIARHTTYTHMGNEEQPKDLLFLHSTSSSSCLSSSSFTNLSSYDVHEWGQNGHLMGSALLCTHKYVWEERNGVPWPRNVV